QEHHERQEAAVPGTRAFPTLPRAVGSGGLHPPGVCRSAPGKWPRRGWAIDREVPDANPWEARRPPGRYRDPRTALSGAGDRAALGVPRPGAALARRLLTRGPPAVRAGPPKASPKIPRSALGRTYDRG